MGKYTISHSIAKGADVSVKFEYTGKAHSEVTLNVTHRNETPSIFGMHFYRYDIPAKSTKQEQEDHGNTFL